MTSAHPRRGVLLFVASLLLFAGMDATALSGVAAAIRSRRPPGKRDL